MYKTTFEITKMDCPSEENLIRLKLRGISSLEYMDFDIPNRKLVIFHSDSVVPIEKSILELNLGGKRISTEHTDQKDFQKDTNQRKILWTVFYINLGFFILEMFTGLLSNSIGLVADSLDQWDAIDVSSVPLQSA